jgi:hypothetical protein
MGFNQRRMARERAAAKGTNKECTSRDSQAEKLVAIWHSRAALEA